MARELELIYGDALAELGVTGPDRTVSAEDGEEMARIYDSTWYLLEEMGLASWDLGGPVPNAVVVPLVWILAFHAAGPFGITGNRIERLRLNGELGRGPPSSGEKLLRKLSAPPYLREPAQTSNF